MATTGWFNTGSNPTLQYRLTATASRSGTTVKISYTIEGRMKKSSNYYGTGYPIKITAVSNGVKKTTQVKTSSESWEGTTIHKKSDSLSITKSDTSTSTTITFSSTVESQTTGKFSNKSLTVTYPAYQTRPGSATNLKTSASSIKPDGNFSLTWSAPSSNGNAAIDKYEVELRKYTASSGSWSAYTDGKVVVTSTSSGTLNGRSLYSDLVVGDQIQCRLATHNKVGWDTTENRPTLTITTYKDGKVMIKDTNGTVREITRIKVKDTNGTVHDIQKVKVKDAGGTVHNIDFYWK